MSVQIGKIKLEYGLCLAPMAGYTDRAMRLVCRECGAEYSVTEMVSAKAVVFRDKKTGALARIFSDEGPVAVQIFGSEPQIMGEAAEILTNPSEGVPPVAIDINMGCPVKKIFSNGEGSALMGNPLLIENIVKSVRAKTHLPVTVKIRAGIDAEHINAVECALAAEAGGASLVCIHGRTREQMYGGRADRKIIEEVKKKISLPVIANGDITSAGEALSMLSDTGADGIAIGRGAVGNPFLFGEIKAVLSGVEYTPPTLEERVEVALKELRYATLDKGERVAVVEARGKIALYLKNFRGAARVRAEINRATCFSEVERALLSVVLQSPEA